MKKFSVFVVFGCLLTACGGGGGGHGGGFIPGGGGGGGGNPSPNPTQTPAPASGTVYVGSYGPSNSVTVFDANGNPKSVSGGFSGLQTDPTIKYSTANSLLYTTNSVSNNVFTVSAFTPQGQAQTLPGSWSGLTNIGSDDIGLDSHNGFVYVPNYSGNAWTMLAYDANGNPQQQAPMAWTGLPRPKAIAFDSHNDQFYIASASAVQVWTESGSLVTPAGGFANLPTAPGVNVQSVLYDPHNNTIYVTESNSTVLTYDENGNVKSQSAWAGVFLPSRMAFNPDNNEIYMLQLTGPFRVTVYDESGNQKTQASTWQNIHGNVNSITIVP